MKTLKRECILRVLHYVFYIPGFYAVNLGSNTRTQYANTVLIVTLPIF